MSPAVYARMWWKLGTYFPRMALLFVIGKIDTPHGEPVVPRTYPRDPNRDTAAPPP